MSSAPCVPLDFEAPCSHSERQLSVKCSLTQCEALRRTIAELLVDHQAGSPFGSAQRLHVAAYYRAVFTKELAIWACMSLGLGPFATKSDAVASLLDAGVPPPSADAVAGFVDHWVRHHDAADEFKDVDAPSDNEGGGSDTDVTPLAGGPGVAAPLATPPRRQNRRSGPVPISLDVPDDDDMLGLALSEDGDSGAEGDDDPGVATIPTTASRSLEASLTAMFTQVADALRQVRAGTSESKSAADDVEVGPACSVSHLEGHMARVTSRVRQRMFVDPMELGPQFLEKLRFRRASGLKRERVGTLVISSSGDTVPSTASKFDPEEMKAGFIKLVSLHLQDEDLCHRAADMLKFHEQVWSYPRATDLGRAKFMKFFLERHCASESLMGSWLVEHDLMHRFLWTPVLDPGLYAAGHAPKRPRPSGVGSGSHSSSSSSSSSSSGNSSRKLQLCFSRLDRSAVCTRTNCRFSHKCASCGRDHPLSECSNFDAAKVAVAKTNNAQTRRG